MIEIQNVNKYFNKGRRNEIHAINNTSLTLPDSGLVALLGESGCGKTTMLNAIGGLDKVKSGKIIINGKKITRHNMSSVDKIRNLSVGYIFQDYKLIDDMSVYDNVALALKMIGIKDKAEVKVRVEYVLDKVGILRYRKRPAGTISGGERQRVGIARALVKNPDIILADEPTGNLDSKNSVEIMNIIKKISKDRLVILVTHERNLAEFYADRIIEVVDGTVVNDKDNSDHSALDYEIDNVFYLKEFANHDSYKDEAGYRQINVYSDDQTKLNVNIIVRNGNIYIQAENTSNVELIDENSSIEVVDDFKQEINDETIAEYDFDMSNVGNQSLKKHYSSIFNPITAIIAGFKKVVGFSILRKLLLVGFIFAGMFIIFAVGKIGATYHVEDIDFIESNKQYVCVQKPGMTVDEFKQLESRDDVLYMLPTKSCKAFAVSIGDYYQTQNAQLNVGGSIASKDLLTSDDVIIGNLPENESEIVVDKIILDKLFDNNATVRMTNTDSYESLLNREANLQYSMGTYTIVGIVDTGSPSVYVDESQFVKILKYGYDCSSDDYDVLSYYYDDTEEEALTTSQITYYKDYEDKITLVDGWNFKSRLPEADYEVLLPDTMQESYPYGKETKLKVNDHKLVVCGYYKSELADGTTLSAYFTNENMILYPLIKSAKVYMLCTDDNAALVADLKDQGYTVYDTYEKSLETYNEERADSVKSSAILALVMIAVSVIEMFLMSRSSFLSRIKEVGTLRAIGAKKFDIYKMFMGEAIAITTFTSLPAMLIMYYVENYLVGEISYLEGLFYMPIPVLVLTILAVYVFNLLVSWIPVWNTMRKRPAAILARHDVD